MNIAVFGLGYVGSVTAACLAADGHRVHGVDPSREKVSSINSGEVPVKEPGLGTLIEAVVGDDRLQASSDWRRAVAESDIAIVCVGTPSLPDGQIDTSHVERVCVQIGEAMASRRDRYTIVLRSTVLPGTTRSLVLPTLETASRRGARVDFDVVFNPEFLREGTSIEDFYDPPKIVVGTDDGKPNHVLNELYSKIESQRLETTYEVAELAKYVDNTWHALKVGFANEVGRISRAVGIDGRDVMEIMVADTKLNISGTYLKPGFAYGGSCLPKDVSALNAFAHQTGLQLPIVDAVGRSNSEQVESAVDLIRSIGKPHVGILGLSFKRDTDDVRNSPFIELARRLIDEGLDVLICEPNLDVERVLGTNSEYLREHLPEVAELLVTDEASLLAFADVVVLGKPEPSFVEATGRLRGDQVLVDLVGVEQRSVQGEYLGIAW